jgi:hypothetical protein
LIYIVAILVLFVGVWAAIAVADADKTAPRLRAVLTTPEGCVLYRARGARELFVCPAGIHGELRT